MFFGNDVAEIYRQAGRRNRDGDQEWELSHRVVGCNFQPSGLTSWPESDKSDGGQTKYAIKANSVLYAKPDADIKEGDRVIVGNRNHRVVSPPLIHRFPSGLTPGMKIHLTEVRKW